jgi:hypothetical protein
LVPRADGVGADIFIALKFRHDRGLSSAPAAGAPHDQCKMTQGLERGVARALFGTCSPDHHDDPKGDDHHGYGGEGDRAEPGDRAVAGRIVDDDVEPEHRSAVAL